jgi:hypothetical protein
MTEATEAIRYVPRLRAPASTTWEVFDTQDNKGVTDTEVLNAEQASVRELSSSSAACWGGSRW